MPRISRIGARYGFYLLFAVCFGLGGVHLAVEGGGLGTTLEAVLIWGLSTVVLYTAVTHTSRTISREGRWQAIQISAAIAASFCLLAFAVWLVWFVEGEQMELSFLLSFATALGAAVGSRGGLYAVESREQLERARELSQLLRINQRVLRHNLRNELAIALGHLEDIEHEVSDDEVARRVDIARNHLQSLNETSDQARQLVSIWETEETHELDLSGIVERRLAAIRAEYPDVALTADFPPKCRVLAHPKLAEAVEEALRNAVEHNPPDVSISVSVVENEDDTVALEISDTGSGIPEIDQAAFDTSEENELIHAQGIGLWFIYWVVYKSGGALEIEENEPTGAVLRMTFPSAS